MFDHFFHSGTFVEGLIAYFNLDTAWWCSVFGWPKGTLSGTRMVHDLLLIHLFDLVVQQLRQWQSRHLIQLSCIQLDIFRLWISTFIWRRLCYRVCLLLFQIYRQCGRHWQAIWIQVASWIFLRRVPFPRAEKIFKSLVNSLYLLFQL